MVNIFKFYAPSKDSAGAAATAGKSVTLGYWDKVKRAARDNKPDVLRDVMKEDVNYDEKAEAGEFGWTALQ